MGKYRFGCADSISQIRVWNLHLIMFKQFTKRWRENLDLLAQTLLTEGGNIAQAFKGVYSLQSKEPSVSSIIHLELSLPVAGYLQIGSSTFQSLSFFKDERQCIQTHVSSSFSPALLCLLEHPFSAAAPNVRFLKHKHRWLCWSLLFKEPIFFHAGLNETAFNEFICIMICTIS